MPGICVKGKASGRKPRGRLRVYAEMGLALATGKLTPAALKKGMNLSKRFSTAETFLQGHRESEARMAEIAASGDMPALANADAPAASDAA